jgi:hypothetical protein
VFDWFDLPETTFKSLQTTRLLCQDQAGFLMSCKVGVFDLKACTNSRWLMPDIGVVFSSTLVFGPKDRDSKAQANGLRLCEAQKLLAA